MKKTTMLLAAAVAAMAMGLSSTVFASPEVRNDVQAAPASHAVVQQEQAPALAAVAIAPAHVAVGSVHPALSVGSASGGFLLTVFPAMRTFSEPGLVARRSRSPVWT